MKIIFVLLLIQLYLPSFSQITNNKYKTFFNSQIGVQFNYPYEWETGTPSISNIYWVGIPNYNSKGNVVLKVIPWAYKVDIPKTTMEIYKKDILSSSIYYKDLVFFEFNNKLKISGHDGIFSYYKGFGKYVDKTYYEILIQWWSNNLLYTIQAQFTDPELTMNQIEEFRELIKTIKSS